MHGAFLRFARSLWLTRGLCFACIAHTRYSLGSSLAEVFLGSERPRGYLVCDQQRHDDLLIPSRSSRRDLMHDSSCEQCCSAWSCDRYPHGTILSHSIDSLLRNSCSGARCAAIVWSINDDKIDLISYEHRVTKTTSLQATNLRLTRSRSSSILQQ